MGGHGRIGIEDGLLSIHNVVWHLLTRHLGHHGHAHLRVGVGVRVRSKSRGECGRVLEWHCWLLRGGGSLALGNGAACVGWGKLVHLRVCISLGKGLLGKEDKLPESVRKNQGVDLQVDEEEGEEHNNNCKENEYCVIIRLE